MEMECGNCGYTIYYPGQWLRDWFSGRDTCTCDIGDERPLSAVESLGRLAE